jgi:trehalose 6-phosphate synthase
VTLAVSNRGPLTFRQGADGALIAVPAGGGLASSLRNLLVGTEATWVSVTMGAADRAAAEAGLLTMADQGLHLVTVPIDDDTYRQAYDVVANTTLWYCHHHLFDLPHRPRFDRHWRTAWDGFVAYNRAVADVVIASAAEGEVVLVQDYHFSLLGSMLAEARPDLRTAHFLHTPFADPNMLGVLPDFAAEQILEGMSGFGACGFHCAKWEAGFVACFAAAGRPVPPTFVSPLSPDHEDLIAEAASPACAAAAEVLRAETGGRRLIVRADRMEPSKNIVRGMLAYEELLTTYPQWRGEVVHVALAYPSRQGLAEYLAYAADVVHTAERINAAFGTADWTPIALHVDDDWARSLAALTISDVLLINPVRDGLNLVAKEGPLLNQRAGVLVLSREAGAWDELAPAALGVNPFDVTGTAEALHTALSMDDAGRRRRASQLSAIVRGRHSADWMRDQMAAAQVPTPR